MNISKQNQFLTIILSASLCFLDMQASAQVFNYSFSRSTASYTALINPTVITENKLWVSETYRIPLGFDFNYHGSSFDSVYILPGGLISFDPNKVHAFYFMMGMNGRMDLERNCSSVHYSTSGSQGSRILKIQYTDVSFEAVMSSSTADIQVWLYESNGTIDVRYGPNSYYTLADSAYSTVVGPVSYSNGIAVNSFLLKGNPSAPVAEAPLGEGNLRFLIRVPSPDDVYTFTPN
jgi:hypothetical protein